MALEPSAPNRFRIERSTFAEVLPYWRDRLWPGRESAIEPASIISPRGALELRLENLVPCFWIARTLAACPEIVGETAGMIVGVNSGFRTSAEDFRSRGLWVAEPYRSQGIATLLIEAVTLQAAEEDCAFLWSMPRASALPFYLKLGFRVYGATDRYEFGPHSLVRKTLGTRHTAHSFH